MRAGLTRAARKQLTEDTARVLAWMRPHFRELIRTDA